MMSMQRVMQNVNVTQISTFSNNKVLYVYIRRKS